MHPSYALANALSLAGFTAIFWGWGMLLGGKTLAIVWRPVLGAAAVAVIAPAAYFHGLPPGITGLILLAVGVVGGLQGIWRRRGTFSPPASLLAGAGITAFLLWLPLAIGGAQFGIFHSNPYDQLSYVSSAATTISEPYATVANASPADVLRDPLIANTHYWMRPRYGVVDVYAIWRGLAPAAIPVAAGGMLAAFLLTLYFGVTGLMTAIVGSYRPRLALIAAALVLGFWGQMQLDLNSWGWTMAAPMAVAEFGLLAEMFREDAAQGRLTWRSRALALGVITAGFAHLYPEMGALFVPAIIAGAAATGLVRRRWTDDVRTLGMALVAALLLVLPAVRLLFGTISHQYAFAPTMDLSLLDWVWQSVIAPGAPAADTSFHGLRWLGLLGGAGWAPQAGLRFAGDVTTVVAALLAVGFGVRWGRRRPEVIFLGVALGAIAMMILVMMALDRRWLAFKAVSYVAVVAWPLLVLPVALRRPGWWKVPAALVLAASLILAVLRIDAARSADGLYYRGYGYLAPLDPVLKQARRWELPELGAALAGVRAVKIDVPDLWLELYAMIVADGQGMPFFKTTPVTDIWHFTNRDQGLQSEIAGYDALIYLEYDFATHQAGLGLARREGAVYSTRSEARVVRIDAGSPLDTRGGMLAWALRATPPGNTVHLAVECDRAAEYIFRLSVTAPPEMQGRAQLAIQGGAGLPQMVAVLPLNEGTMQLLAVPVTLHTGRNSIAVALQPSPGVTGKTTDVWLANPRLERATRP